MLIWGGAERLDWSGGSKRHFVRWVVGGKCGGEDSSTLRWSEIQGEFLRGHLTKLLMRADAVGSYFLPIW